MSIRTALTALIWAITAAVLIHASGELIGLVCSFIYPETLP